METLEDLLRHHFGVVCLDEVHREAEDDRIVDRSIVADGNRLPLYIVYWLSSLFMYSYRPSVNPAVFVTRLTQPSLPLYGR